MTSYEYYKIARNKAWKVLIECGINKLPLDLTKIINFYNIETRSFSNSNYVKTLNFNVQNGDGFSQIENGQKIIYFNDKKGAKVRRRFTIAHELGHCLLGHLKDNNKTFYRNSEIDLPNNSIEEMQANVFARDILMPAIILHCTNCINYKDIKKLCNVSETSAKIREERMKILEQKSKFCLNNSEKQVFNNFANFIETYKK